MPGYIPQSRLMLLNQGVSQCLYTIYKLTFVVILLYKYGSTGCGVFHQGTYTKLERFLPKNNIPKGN